jgi:hypothetical protein
MLPNPSTNPSSTQPEPPFLIRVEHRNETRNGTFCPVAHVTFHAPLRTSGLLQALSPEAARDLLLLLTFVTPNGLCSPTVSQIARAMRVSEGKARSRFGRLLALRWQGEPLIAHFRTQSGLETFSPLPGIAPVQENAAPPPAYLPPPPIPVASREAVIAHSRAAYTRPRAEVEREIEERMNYARSDRAHGHRTRHDPAHSHPIPDSSLRQPILPASVPPEPAPLSPEEAEALRERQEVAELLLQAGLQVEQAEALLAGYDLVRIRRQLMWLPYRRAKNPAGMLLAAIKDDYEAPPALWRPVAEQPVAEQLLPEQPVAPAQSSDPAVGAHVDTPAVLDNLDAVAEEGAINLEVP